MHYAVTDERINIGINEFRAALDAQKNCLQFEYVSSPF